LNLIYQYYIPYESGDSHLGGENMPDWAHAGLRSARAYAKLCGAEHFFDTKKYLKHIDPRLNSIKIFYDSQFERYDKILSIDLDMLIRTKENIFDIPIEDVAMVHELGVHTGGPAGWMRRVMDVPIWERGIIAYGKHLFGKDWMFPKSKLYPNERFRYMNGGLQLWSKEGRAKAKKYFTSIDDYILHTRYTEQMYINLQLSQQMFKVTELSSEWDRMPYQWKNGRPDGKINHFLARAKFEMPNLERKGFSVWEPS